MKVLKSFNAGKVSAQKGDVLDRDQISKLSKEGREELIALGCLEGESKASAEEPVSSEPVSEEQVAEVLEEAAPSENKPKKGKKN